MAQSDNYDRLVVKCASTDIFDANETYYSYDKNAHPGEAVRPVEITAE